MNAVSGSERAKENDINLNTFNNRMKKKKECNVVVHQAFQMKKIFFSEVLLVF